MAERQVRKGQKGAKAFFFSRLNIEDDPEDGESTNTGFQKFYFVYNADQLESINDNQASLESPVFENTHASEQSLCRAKSENVKDPIEGEHAVYQEQSA
ncbi:MAG: hypothetical protein AB8B84_01510 [Granulosicoccus sp.]